MTELSFQSQSKSEFLAGTGDEAVSFASSRALREVSDYVRGKKFHAKLAKGAKEER